MKHNELLRNLEQFQIDSPEASLPFSARLARETNWTTDFTRRVISEYKRFAFLAVVAGHPVSPSEAVDEAWHLPEKERLARAMQKVCGSGGTIKEGEIEIQGDKREEVARILAEANFSPVFAGG